MKEFKFRLRSSINKVVGYEKWYTGAMDSKNFYIAKPQWLYSKDGEKWNPEFIEHRLKDRYTGLKDNSNPPKEIYESSLIKVFSHIYKVYFDERIASFQMANQDKDMPNDSGFVMNASAEVIGNIFQNKELLK